MVIPNVNKGMKRIENCEHTGHVKVCESGYREWTTVIKYDSVR